MKPFLLLATAAASLSLFACCNNSPPAGSGGSTGGGVACGNVTCSASQVCSAGRCVSSGNSSGNTAGNSSGNTGGSTGGGSNGGSNGSNGGSTGSSGANCVLPANITTNMTLDTSCNPWEVTGVTTVNGSGASAPTLIIDPGVTVVFDQLAALQVGVGGQGVIHAVGTSNLPINFKANTQNPSAGYWQGVYLGEQTQSTSEMGFVKFDSAGGLQQFGGGVAGSLVTDSQTAVFTVKLHDLTFTHDGANGIVMAGFNVGFGAGSGNLTVNDWGSGMQPFVVTANQAGTLPTTLVVPAGSNGMVDLIDGDGDLAGGGNSAWVRSTQTWPAIPIPYLVDGQTQGSGGGLDIEGPTTGNATLTIAAPNTLEFLAGGEVFVDPVSNGTANLVANGTVQNPIVFTSAGSSSPGFWAGIEFVVLNGGLPNSSLTNDIIANAGNVFQICSIDAPVWINGPTTVPKSELTGPTITGCTLQNYPSSNTGILTNGISSTQVSTYGSANTFQPQSGGSTANVVDGNVCN
ncbi:MAG: hypothetical protein ACYDCL_16875 [Myxococcales bacterium]